MSDKEKTLKENLPISMSDIFDEEDMQKVFKQDTCFTYKNYKKRFDKLLKQRNQGNWFVRKSKQLGDFLSQYRFQILVSFIIFVLTWIMLNSPFFVNVLNDLEITCFNKILMFDPAPFKILSFCIALGTIILTQFLLAYQKDASKINQVKTDLDLETNMHMEELLFNINKRLKNIEESNLNNNLNDSD